MRDLPKTSHHSVASRRKLHLACAQAPKFNNPGPAQTDSSFSDDNDWEADGGKLVIDLDVDTSRSPQKGASPQKGSPQKAAPIADTVPNVGPVTSAGKPVHHAMEHQATVDKGLKMKIKRKNSGAKTDTKHEIVREARSNSLGLNSGTDNQNVTMDTKAKKSEEKPIKGRNSQKDKRGKSSNSKQNSESNLTNGSAFAVPPLPGSVCGGYSHNQNLGTNEGGSKSRVSANAHSFCENEDNCSLESLRSAPAPDPYEFNAKVEDRIGLPHVKKIKLEKSESIPASNTCTKEVGVETNSTGVMTDPDCLGPCEPGTSVTLEGIVWQETENGMLVVNVTWRSKTYVGTLLDATKHDWAPPRLGCESPVVDIETRTPKGRGKRGRGGTQAPLNDVSNTDRRLRKGRRRNSGATNSTFTAPPSPAKSETNIGNALKRKGRPTDLDLSETLSAKRSRSCSSTRSTPTNVSEELPSLIECPEPNCSKKYRHINGLRYHQSHAHQGGCQDDGQESVKSNKDDTPVKESRVSPEPEDTVESSKEKPKSERTGKSKSKKSAKQDKESRNAARGVEMEISSPSKLNTLTSTKTCASSENKNTVDTKKQSGEDDAKVENESNKGPVATSDTQSVTDSSQGTSSDNKVLNDSQKIPGLVNSQADIKATTSSVIDTTAPPVNSKTAKPHITYQISGPAAIGCVGGITVVSGAGQTVGSAIGTIGTKVGGQLGVCTNITTVSVPVATVVTATTVDIPKADEKTKKSKPEKMDKSKGKGTAGNRPIVPAPITVSQGLATMTTHAQLSPITSTTSSLKPIQPKPTILGEPTSINPALTSLKDKKAKKKKSSKEKDSKEPVKNIKEGSSVLIPAPTTPAKDPQVKVESTSVIKSAPSAALSVPSRTLGPEAGPRLEPTKEVLAARSISVLGKDRPHEGPPQLVQHQPSHPGSIATPQTVSVPPTGLDIKSPVPTSLDSGAADSRENSDVHSPAYSDISDANDSAPTLESESDLDRNKSEGQQGNTDGPAPEKGQEQVLPRSYGMYALYYSNPPNLVPAVQPAKKKGTEQTSSAGSEQVKNPEETMENKLQIPSSEQITRESTDPEHSKVTSRPDAAKPAPSPSSSSSSQTADMMQQHRLAQLYQYQYMYNLSPDALHVHLVASDPNYRANYEKYMKDQKSRKQESEGTDGDKGSTGVVTTPGDKPGTISRPNEAQSIQQPRTSPGQPGQEKPESKPPALISDRERAEKERQQAVALQREREMEQNLKEKQNENRQILKENIELKNQMDSNRQRFHSYDHKSLLERQQEELKRYYMYQHQHRMMEQRAAAEGERRKLMEHPRPNDASRKAGEATVVADNSGLPKDKAQPFDMRTDSSHARASSVGSQGPKDLSSPKPAPEKRHGEDSIPSPRVTPKPKEPSDASTPSSTSGGSYPQYVPHPYLQSPHYAQMGFDASHPMYRGVNPIIGYAGPAYIHHPSQVRFMGPGETPEKEQAIASASHAPDQPNKIVEPVQQHPPHFYGGPAQHKIHELKEVGKSEHVSPAKQSEADRQASPFTKQREHSSSPPTQRHLHSHHHTHVVTPGYPIYDPYSAALLASTTPQVPGSSALPHPYIPK